MSCSDKLVRWGILGLQGSLLSRYIPAPISLSSIVISKDPRSVDDGQIVSLERALSGRIEKALKTMPTHAYYKIKPPTVAVVDDCLFESSKSASESRYFRAQTKERKRNIEQLSRANIEEALSSKRSKLNDHKESSCRIKSQSNLNTPESSRIKKESACGMSINWHQSYQNSDSTKKYSEKDAKKATEITIGATGLKRGKKPRSPSDVLGSVSRLCRFNFLHQCKICIALEDSLPCRANVVKSAKKGESSDAVGKEMSYMQYKQHRGRNVGEECFQGPLMGWIRSGEDDDFMLPRASD